MSFFNLTPHLESLALRAAKIWPHAQNESDFAHATFLSGFELGPAQPNLFSSQPPDAHARTNAHAKLTLKRPFPGGGRPGFPATPKAKKLRPQKQPLGQSRQGQCSLGAG